MGIRLFLNINNADSTIKSEINDSHFDTAEIKPNDVIIKIDDKSTRGISL